MLVPLLWRECYIRFPPSFQEGSPRVRKDPRIAEALSMTALETHDHVLWRRAECIERAQKCTRPYPSRYLPLQYERRVEEDLPDVLQNDPHASSRSGRRWTLDHNEPIVRDFRAPRCRHYSGPEKRNAA